MGIHFHIAWITRHGTEQKIETTVMTIKQVLAECQSGPVPRYQLQAATTDTLHVYKD
jgi:hypothetical protein